MLKPIAQALKDYDEKGIAVIVETEGVDPREIAAYAIATLRGLKCSFDHYYNDVEHSYFIVDNMSEVPNGEAISKCDCCGKMSLLGGMFDLTLPAKEFNGIACKSCYEELTNDESKA